MRKGAFPRVLVTAAFFLASSEVLATTVVRLSLGDLVARAERVVEGRVVAVGFARDGRARPATRVTFEVRTLLKGAPAPAIEWLQPGGFVEGEGLSVAGMPVFREGDEMLVFLSAASTSGTRAPIGLGQGAWRARRDPKSGETSYRADLLGLDLVDPKTGRPSPGAPAELRREELLARVRALAEGK